MKRVEAGGREECGPEILEGGDVEDEVEVG